MIDTLILLLQVIIAIVIFAVWLVRPKLETNYRAGNATNIFEEFEVYGLPNWSVYLVGGIKLGLAILLIAGIWYSSVVQYAALGMGILMAGAKTRAQLCSVISTTIKLLKNSDAVMYGNRVTSLYGITGVHYTIL